MIITKTNMKVFFFTRMRDSQILWIHNLPEMKKIQKWMFSQERDSNKPNILPDSFLGVFILDPNPKERTDHKS